MAVALSQQKIGTLVSVIAACAIALGVAGRSCALSDVGPEAAVRAFIAAANAQDRSKLMQLLTPATQQRLAAEAKRATELAGAKRRFAPLDMIAVASDVAPVVEVALVEQLGTYATVEIISAESRSRVQTTQIDGRWLIDLPNYPAR